MVMTDEEKAEKIAACLYGSTHFPLAHPETAEQLQPHIPFEIRTSQYVERDKLYAIQIRNPFEERLHFMTDNQNIDTEVGDRAGRDIHDQKQTVIQSVSNLPWQVVLIGVLLFLGIFWVALQYLFPPIEAIEIPIPDVEVTE